MHMQTFEEIGPCLLSQVSNQGYVCKRVMGENDVNANKQKSHDCQIMVYIGKTNSANQWNDEIHKM